MTSPMQRTLKVIKEDNLPYWIVETWNHFTKRRTDLFNIIDLIVLDSGIVGVQVFGSDFSSHRKKIMDEHKTDTFNWLENGGQLQMWGWRKLKKVRGKKAMVWIPRIADILLINNELYLEERK